MSYLLRDPTVLLVVGEGGVGEAVRDALVVTRATAVDAVPTVDAAVKAVAERDDVGCVLLLGAAGARTVAAACDAVHEDAVNLPVIAFVDDGDDAGVGAGGDAADPSVAAELASREHCRYLPREAPPAAVGAAADDALATFDRRRREAAESSLLRTLLSDSDVPIFAKDERGRHLYKSDLSSDESTGDVVGKTDIDLAEQGWEAGARRAYRDDVRLLETGDPIHGQEERGGTGHDEYWSQVTKVPWRDDDGDVRGLVGISFDITWWKERERQLDAQQRRVDQFATYLRHDLRTPLQVACGALERARDGDDDAFETVERAHERMTAVVDDLSDLSPGTSASRVPDEAYDAVGLGINSFYLVSMVEDLWAVQGSPETTLSLDLPADTVVVARSGTVRPLVESLLKNAVEHAGPDATVRVGITDDGFFVADDGPGVPEAIAAALSAHDAETVREVAGTGLLVVLDSVRELGWDVSVVRGDEGGTRVDIRNCNVISGTPADAAPASRTELSSTADVGQSAVPGSAAYDADSDRWRVSGAGKDVWGDANEFHFVYGTADAPARVEGRIDGLDGIHEFSKAGFAIRASLDADAPFGYVGTTEAHGSEVLWRLTADARTDSELFEERPLAFQWYRVDYVDGEVTCYLSEDGAEWHAVDQRSVDLGETVSLGILVSSHDPDRTCTATFRDVRAWELDRP